MGTWELIYYETATGACPVQAFLDDLSSREAERVIRQLDLLEVFGTEVRAPHVRHLEGRIWELRVRGRLHHRVLYVALAQQRIVLLHAFTKKVRKTPRSDIDLAKHRLADYEERYMP